MACEDDDDFLDQFDAATVEHVTRQMLDDLEDRENADFMAGVPVVVTVQPSYYVYGNGQYRIRLVD